MIPPMKFGLIGVLEKSGISTRNRDLAAREAKLKSLYPNAETFPLRTHPGYRGGSPSVSSDDILFTTTQQEAEEVRTALGQKDDRFYVKTGFDIKPSLILNDFALPKDNPEN